MVIIQSDIDKMVEKLTKAGGDIIHDDYLLVVPSGVIMSGVFSIVPIVTNEELENAAYLIKRSDYLKDLIK